MCSQVQSSLLVKNWTKVNCSIKIIADLFKGHLSIYKPCFKLRWDLCLVIVLRTLKALSHDFLHTDPRLFPLHSQCMGWQISTTHWHCQAIDCFKFCVIWSDCYIVCRLKHSILRLCHMRQACSSHHKICFWFSICQTQPKYPQIVKRQCCLCHMTFSSHTEKGVFFCMTTAFPPSA